MVPEPLLQIGGERYVAVDQVSCDDQLTTGPEPAAADPSGPQAVAPDHTYHLDPSPPDFVQDLACDANV